MINKIFKKTLMLAFAIVLVFGITACNFTKPDSGTSVSVGYLSYSPGFIVDPNTKEKSGVFNDILQEIAERKGFTIEYAEEVTRGTMIETLNANRVDMIASPVWATDERIANAELSDPVYYSPIGAYVRVDDDRFDIIENINNPSIKIAAVDGEGGQVIAKTQFPDANLVSFPNTVDLSQMLLEVASSKEDVTFMEPIFAYGYMQANPGKLKNVAEKSPVKNWPNNYMFKKGNTKLMLLINEGIAELIVDGTMDRIISQYEPFEGSVTRVK